MKAVLYDKTRQRVPVKIWTPVQHVESEALDQLKNVAGLPFVFKHVAVMPDVHVGKGATVGSVIATQGAVIPAAVGVDIGCGMCAIKTDLDYRVVQEKIKEIRNSIERSIPVGHLANHRISKSVESWDGWKKWDQLNAAKKHTKGKELLGAWAEETTSLKSALIPIIVYGLCYTAGRET
jgi:tRNA-splicing ligase RtcB (3'-phosphate/5'-hydroxy nucleic acid ligase)